VVDAHMINMRVSVLTAGLTVWLNQAKPTDLAKEKSAASKGKTTAASIMRVQKVVARPVSSSSGHEDSTTTAVAAESLSTLSKPPVSLVKSHPSSACGGPSGAPMPSIFSMMRKQSAAPKVSPADEEAAPSGNESTDATVVDLSGSSPQKRKTVLVTDSYVLAAQTPAPPTHQPPQAPTSADSIERPSGQAKSSASSLCTPSPLTVISQLSPNDTAQAAVANPSLGDAHAESTASVCQKRSIDVVVLDADSDNKQQGEEAAPTGSESTAANSSHDAKRTKVVPSTDQPKMKMITSFFQKKTSQ
jgi:hypothetical protein